MSLPGPPTTRSDWHSDLPVPLPASREKTGRWMRCCVQRHSVGSFWHGLAYDQTPTTGVPITILQNALLPTTVSITWLASKLEVFSNGSEHYTEERPSLAVTIEPGARLGYMRSCQSFLFFFWGKASSYDHLSRTPWHHVLAGFPCHHRESFSRFSWVVLLLFQTMIHCLASHDIN